MGRNSKPKSKHRIDATIRKNKKRIQCNKFCVGGLRVLMLLSRNVMKPFRWLYYVLCIDVFSQKCSKSISMVRLRFKQYID